MNFFYTSFKGTELRDFYLQSVHTIQPLDAWKIATFGNILNVIVY
jgi:hypothetical protein